MAGIELRENNVKEILELLTKTINNALEVCGGKAETYAKRDCPVDMGTLRNSISHKVDTAEGKAYIGTNVEYAPYVELGTGIYYKGGGRKTPWVYQDSKGKWHRTNGQKAQPFLRPAVANHAEEYQTIIKKALKGEE